VSFSLEKSSFRNPWRNSIFTNSNWHSFSEQTICGNKILHQISFSNTCPRRKELFKLKRRFPQHLSIIKKRIYFFWHMFRNNKNSISSSLVLHSIGLISTFRWSHFIPGFFEEGVCLTNTEGCILKQICSHYISKK